MPMLDLGLHLTVGSPNSMLLPKGRNIRRAIDFINSLDLSNILNFVNNSIVLFFLRKVNY